MQAADIYSCVGKGKSQRISALLVGTSLFTVFCPSVSFAQATAPQAGTTAADNAIVVTGTRQTIQDSIQTKKSNDLIVDALNADEIGDLPALSIGEALETLTGAASHREQGGATEIAIRGLGPFLSSTTINGRLASNGSGDRSVNFSQFPSELFTKIAIYKTQSASLIEGGVAGQIQLQTVRPLDYGKRRIQADLKIPYNPDNLDIDPDQRFRKFGYRGTLSYVDQFDLGGEAELGFSIGYSRNVSTNPEQEANTSNTIRACKNDPSDTSDGVFDDGNCDTSGVIQPTDDFVIVPNSYAYRSNITDDKRDAVFAAIQFRPNRDIEINADFQYSKRFYREQRSDFGLVEGRRIDGLGDPNRLPFDLMLGEGGVVLQSTSEQRAEVTSEYLRRNEEYYGGGLSIGAQVTDRLHLSADASYSRTRRIEDAVQIRFRTENQQDIFGNDDQYPLSRESDGSGQNDRIENAILVRQNGSQIFNFVLEEFDPRNYDLFRDSARLRADLEQDRFNELQAYRADARYDLDGFFANLQAGVRYQKLVYRDVPGASSPNSRFERTYSDAALAVANQECRTAFPESGFLSSVSGGNPLFTISDIDGNVLDQANSYATFNALCVAQVLEREDPRGLMFDDNGVPIYPTGDFDSIQNSDVRERTWAGYIQADFDGDLGQLPVRGNVGLRVVNTKVLSTGFRGSLTPVFDDVTGELVAIEEDTDTLVAQTGGGSYTEFLPSLNVTAEFQPELLGRFAIYRALSRPDPSALGYGRSFNALIDDGAPVFSVAEALGSATATGNPFTDPLLSWNVDAAIEWYPNPDTILSFGAYYKRFNGGFETVGQTEVFDVGGEQLETIVTTTNTKGESSSLYGFEITAAHRLSWLPQPLDGLGFKLSYNYANSNFEFEDDVLGEATILNADGSIASVRPGLVPPAEIFGLSKHVLSAQVYYQIGKLDLQGVYKYRSDYFQQFVGTPGRIRYVDDTGVFEARITYKLNDNVQLRLEGINLFNEPRVNYRGRLNNLSSVQVYGPRYFAGVKVKF